MQTVPVDRTELLRAVAERFPNGSISVFDRELRYVLAEGEGLASAGLSASSLIGRTLHEVFDAASVGYVEPFYRRALSGESVQFDLPVFGRVYHISARPLVEEEDSLVTTIVVIAQDITGTIQVQQRLEATERELRAALARL